MKRVGERGEFEVSRSSRGELTLRLREGSGGDIRSPSSSLSPGREIEQEKSVRTVNYQQNAVILGTLGTFHTK